MAKTDFKSVDEYLATRPEGVQAILRRGRGAIRRAVPGAEEAGERPRGTAKTGRSMSAADGWRRPGTLLLLGLVVGGGCGRLRDSRDVGRRSSAMVLLDGAREVVYYDNYDPSGRPELEQISYLLDVPFPAEDVICRVSQHLARNGWRPLQRTHDDVGTPSSYTQGWRGLISRRGSPDEHHVDLWDAEWVNAEGDLLSYSLTYRYRSTGPVNRTRMRVGGIRQPAHTVSPADRARSTQGGTVAAGEPPRVAPGETAPCVPGAEN